MGTGPVPCHLLLSPLPTPRHRPKSVTSCFFSLPSTLFSHAPRQFDRTPTPTPTPRLRPQSPPHRTWDLDLYLDPDLILCCTPSARSLPTHISVQEVVSSLPRRSTTTLLTTDLVCLPIRYPEVCKTSCTRQGHKEKARGAQTDNKPLHRVNFQPSEPSLHIYSSAVYLSVKSVHQLASQPACQPAGLTDPGRQSLTFPRLVALNSSRGVTS